KASRARSIAAHCRHLPKSGSGSFVPVYVSRNVALFAAGSLPSRGGALGR
ncbi:phospholipase b, partial [Moniliophthora roreri]